MDKKPAIILLGVGVIILLILAILFNFSDKNLKLEPSAISEDLKQKSLKNTDLSLTLTKEEIESAWFVVKNTSLENPLITERLPYHISVSNKEEYEYILLSVIIVDDREELDYEINAFQNINYANYVYDSYIESYQSENICDVGERCNYKEVGDANPNILLWFVKGRYIIRINLYKSQERDIDKIKSLGKLIDDKIKKWNESYQCIEIRPVPQ